MSNNRNLTKSKKTTKNNAMKIKLKFLIFITKKIFNQLRLVFIEISYLD